MTVGCETPSPPPAPEPALAAAPAPLDALTRRIGRVRERLRTRGYHPFENQVRRFVLEGEGDALPVDLPAGACTTFVGLGSRGIRDLRMTLVDADGETVGRDEVPGEGALVHACPPEDGAFYLVVQAIAGDGTVAIFEQRSGPEEGGGFEGIFDDVLSPTQPRHELDETMSEVRRALRARGYAPVGEPARDQLDEGGVLRGTFELTGGRCYAALARSVPSVTDLDFFVFDPSGVEVTRDVGAGIEPTVELCPTESGAYLVEARVYSGRGAVESALFLANEARSPSDTLGTVIDEAPRRLEPRAIATSALDRLRQAGFGEPAFLVESESIAPHEVRSHDVRMGPGCVVVLAAGSEPAMDLDLYLADENGRELDRDTTVHATASVRGCFDSARSMRVAIKAYGRFGSYVIATTRAPSSIDDLPTLRLFEITQDVEERGASITERVDLTLGEGERDVRALTIAPHRCVTVAAAGDEGVFDVDLYLRDLEGGLVAAEAGASPQASIERCGGDEGQSLQVETACVDGRGRVAFVTLEGPEPEHPRVEGDDTPPSH